MKLSPATRKRLTRGGLVVAVVMLGLAAVYGRFSHCSVCLKCGALRDTAEWQIPFTSTTVFQHSTERATPVSRTLLRAGLVAQHEHQWSFVAGSGNGAMCAIGEGRHVLPSAESEGVARLIEVANKFGEVEFRDKLLRTLFDPNTSADVRGLGLSAPTNEFAQASELRSWIAENIPSFDEMVAARKKR